VKLTDWAVTYEGAMAGGGAVDEDTVRVVRREMPLWLSCMVGKRKGKELEIEFESPSFQICRLVMRL
jgi:hypothetical protein